MKKSKIFAGLLMALIGGVAMAGLQFSFPVEVELNPDGSGSARGNMATARYSDNDVDQIGCGVRSNFDEEFGFSEWGFCQAVDAEDEGAFCFTYNPDLINTLNAMSDQSYITFRFNEFGACTDIGFSSQSQYLGQDDDSSSDD